MSQADPILVTGAAGFIGTRFVESCQAQGIPVISVDKPEYFIERKENQGVNYGRIIDREKLFEVLEKENLKPQCIVHLGACTDTFEQDVEYLTRVNLAYSQWLWFYCSKRGIPLVYASSAATYGGGELGYDDDEKLIPRLKPLNPYGESKRLFDEWALEQESRGNHPPQWSGFKFFNVYGFGERHKLKMGSVVLHAFDQIQNSGRVKLFKSHREGIADGHQARDFIFVGDLIKVLHFARTKPLERGVYNLGTGKARTFLDLTRAVFAALGKPEKIEFIDTPEILRAQYQYFTEAKMDRLRQGGYTLPFTSLEDGVKETVKRLLKGQ